MPWVLECCHCPRYGCSQALRDRGGGWLDSRHSHDDTHRCGASGSAGEGHRSILEDNRQGAEAGWDSSHRSSNGKGQDDDSGGASDRHG